MKVIIYFLFFLLVLSCSNLPDNSRVQSDIKTFVIPQFENVKKYHFLGYYSTFAENMAVYGVRIITTNNDTINTGIKYEWVDKHDNWGLLYIEYKE